ncbi:MAG: ribonuclease III [Acetatifactor sp.]|nr:ribonuclease III [Acetatifactor sp.]MDE7114359.1 ribonuclease III [Acetatifactor sp.]
MERTMLDLIKTSFGCEERDVRSYSPLTLAYIGDGVYDLVIRTLVVERANRPPNELHKLTSAYVKAEMQAKIIVALKDELTEEEAQVFKRGRNAKPYTTAKNATRADYHKATGFEAVMGYLYLTGQNQRMLELIRHGLELMEDGTAHE